MAVQPMILVTSIDICKVIYVLMMINFCEIYIQLSVPKKGSVWNTNSNNTVLKALC